MSREAGDRPTNVTPRQPECARCGSCTVVCPVYRVTGRESATARGKLHLLGTGLAETPSALYQDIFARCLLCGACEAVCPRDLPILALTTRARSRFPAFYGRHGLRKVLARKALASPSLLPALVRLGVGLRQINALPADSGLRLKLGLLEQRPEAARSAEPAAGPARPAGESVAGPLYFTGCLARYLQPSVAGATATTAKLARHATGGDIHAPPGQRCCGLAAWAAGRPDEARHLARKNIAAFAGTTGPILTSCASCSSHLQQYPDLFAEDPGWREKARTFSARVREFSSFFLEKTENLKFAAQETARLFYHDPCHLRFTGEGREAPRRLLDLVANCRRFEPDDGPHCCGQGGLFHLGYPDLAERIFATACESALATGPDIVVTTCSGCLMQWQTGLAARHDPARAVHLAVFMASCLVPDS
ncbi:MAG: 4Fe-4S dicluster domain-containing protein [Proteobacteria bacterium]|nr:4Fe-4S dicluster domain-containing protein [Pseudomonadota bacterium]